MFCKNITKLKKVRFKIFDTKHLAKTSQKLKKMRFKIFDIKHLTKISQI
jgi:hypothetical protein